MFGKGYFKKKESNQPQPAQVILDKTMVENTITDKVNEVVSRQKPQKEQISRRAKTEDEKFRVEKALFPDHPDPYVKLIRVANIPVGMNYHLATKNTMNRIIKGTFSGDIATDWIDSYAAGTVAGGAGGRKDLVAISEEQVDDGSTKNPFQG